MTHEVFVQQQRQRILETAMAMLRGQCSYIEGARDINGLWRSADLPSDDSDKTTFSVIDSETDTLPMGEVRKLWNPEALIKLQPAIDHAEKWAEETGRISCENIVTRFRPAFIERDQRRGPFFPFMEKPCDGASETGLEDYRLHDATLLSVSVRWAEGQATIDLQLAEGQHMITALGLKQLRLPHREEWGPSVSVNYTIGPSETDDGTSVFAVHMQSGDVIELIAHWFEGT